MNVQTSLNKNTLSENVVTHYRVDVMYVIHYNSSSTNSQFMHPQVLETKLFPDLKGTWEKCNINLFITNSIED